MTRGSRKWTQPDGHALSSERTIGASAAAIFDAFIALYDSQRPDWVTGSRLDLRPGGRWIVGFQVPDGPAFREDRILTIVERPRRIAYDMRVIQDGAPRFSTAVDVTIERVRGGHRICLAQQGFPTAELRDEFAGAWPDVLAELDRRVSGRVGAG
jgi:uncharacterized protein YndB with AHSA1/START domain